MRRKIADETVIEVYRLLEQDLSQREIARKLGISHSTVSVLEDRRLAGHGPIREPMRRQSVNDHGEATAPAHVCPGCRNTIITADCVICRARGYRAQRQLTVLR